MYTGYINIDINAIKNIQKRCFVKKYVGLIIVKDIISIIANINNKNRILPVKRSVILILLWSREKRVVNTIAIDINRYKYEFNI